MKLITITILPHQHRNEGKRYNIVDLDYEMGPQLAPDHIQELRLKAPRIEFNPEHLVISWVTNYTPEQRPAVIEYMLEYLMKGDAERQLAAFREDMQAGHYTVTDFNQEGAKS